MHSIIKKKLIRFETISSCENSKHFHSHVRNNRAFFPNESCRNSFINREKKQCEFNYNSLFSW